MASLQYYLSLFAAPRNQKTMLMLLIIGLPQYYRSHMHGFADKQKCVHSVDAMEIVCQLLS